MTGKNQDGSDNQESPLTAEGEKYVNKLLLGLSMRFNHHSVSYTMHGTSAAWLQRLADFLETIPRESLPQEVVRRLDFEVHALKGGDILKGKVYYTKSLESFLRAYTLACLDMRHLRHAIRVINEQARALDNGTAPTGQTEIDWDQVYKELKAITPVKW